MGDPITAIIGGIGAAASLGGTIANMAKGTPKQSSADIGLKPFSLTDNSMSLQAPTLNDPNMQPGAQSQIPPPSAGQQSPYAQYQQPNLGSFYNQLNSNNYGSTGTGDQIAQGVF